MKYLLTTQRGLEDLAVSRILEEVDGVLEAKPRPGGYLGLVLIEGRENLKEELEKIPEIERVVPILAECKSRLDEIAETALNLVRGRGLREPFAVRTNRRGKHPFRSIDVNERVGALIVDNLGLRVDLDNPREVVWIEIVDDWTGITILDGREIRRKIFPGKKPSLDILERIVLIQMPYLADDPEASRSMGERIGRAAQAFEVRALVVAHKEPADLDRLLPFLEGLIEGRRSRYEIQVRSYGRKVRKVPIMVYELYQAMRYFRDYFLIATDPKGQHISRVADEIRRALRTKKGLAILMGSREGLPAGVLRCSDLVVDLAPGITFATEHAIPASIIALLTVIYGEGEDVEEDTE